LASKVHYQFLQKTGHPTTPPILGSKSVLDFHSSTFAKQLAYFEYMMFKGVELREFNYWLKGEKEEREIKCPNLFVLTIYK